MPKKAHKDAAPAEPPPEPPLSMGMAPAVLAKRVVKNKHWCPIKEIEYDPLCDPDNPKTITYRDVVRAAKKIKGIVPKTPLWKSKSSEQFKINVFFKLENMNRCGSFCERGAAYVIQTLSTEQKYRGIITASIGNWGKTFLGIPQALAYHGKKDDVRVTVVLPKNTTASVVDKIKECRATVILHGANLTEAKHYAFELMQDDQGLTYINSYDHPAVIAANGTIALEIMEELPTTNVIIAPVGGGGLLAGIIASVKPTQKTHIIGVQPEKSCCLFKALENEKVYDTEVGETLATSLAVPRAGYNAFHTIQPGLHRMILVDDDWIARAMLQLVEEEKIVAEGAGAASLAPLLAVPQILPDLRYQNVVCIISGGGIDTINIPRCIERGKLAEGRLIKFTVTLNAHDIHQQLHVTSVIANLNCNLLHSRVEPFIEEMDPRLVHLKLVCETKNIEHACQLKRVMERLFPNMCRFVQEPYSHLPICVCFPKKPH